VRRLGLAVGLALVAVLAPEAILAPAASASAAGGSAPQQIQLVLPLNANLTGLARFATAVTTPGSPQYRDFQSIPVLERRFGAPPGTRRRVAAYLRRAGATAVRIDSSGLFVVATMRRSLAERLFATTLKTIRSTSGQRYTAPAGAASLPRSLHGLVSGVVGLDTRPLSAAVTHGPRASQPTSAYDAVSGAPAGCAQGRNSGGFTPNQYLTAYGLTGLHNQGLRGAGERVALIEVDGFRTSDLRTFAGCFSVGVPKLHAFGVGVNHPLAPGPEATLDLEVLTAAAPKLAGIDVYETTADAAGSLQAFVAPLENAGFKPQVISASLGLCERSIREALGQSGINTAEAEFQLAAAGGISLLAASGDSGSADCTENDGTPDDFLNVNFPASSPWVTAVGGTNLHLTAQNTIASEVVWNDTELSPGSAGGGGISELFARPSYQSGTVTASHRVLPDVSMLADIAPGYAVFCTANDCVNGAPSPWQSVGGTSAATPLLAGGVAVVDQLMRQHERADIGQLNPLLYRIGHSSLVGRVFNDVTQYGNDVGPYIPGNGQPLGCCTAAAGFDAASGWGSVNLSALAAAALVLQPRAANVKLSLPRHQKPVARHQILATVSCSERCALAAFAEISINHGTPFTAQSKVVQLNSSGRRTVAVKFSAKQLGKLRGALSHHRLVQAFLYGVTVNPQHHILRETSGTLLTVRS
jgi:kumamolisin